MSAPTFFLKVLLAGAVASAPLFSAAATSAVQPVKPAGEPQIVGKAPRILEVTFWSETLQREKKFSVVQPQKPAADAGKNPVLFLLHGRGRNHHSLLDAPKSAAFLQSAPFFVVLPDGEDGWYINSPVAPADRYNDYLEEVIRLAESCLPISREPRRRAITGWSMGGYGAVRFAETHAGQFAAVVGIIGLLDFPRAADLPEGQNYKVPVKRFGEDPAVWAAFNPIWDVQRLKGTPLLVITGREAFDRVMNTNFYARAKAAGVECSFLQLKGAHTFDTVTEALPDVLQFVQSAFDAPGGPPEAKAN